MKNNKAQKVRGWCLLLSLVTITTHSATVQSINRPDPRNTIQQPVGQARQNNIIGQIAEALLRAEIVVSGERIQHVSQNHLGERNLNVIHNEQNDTRSVFLDAENPANYLLTLDSWIDNVMHVALANRNIIRPQPTIFNAYIKAQRIITYVLQHISFLCQHAPQFISVTRSPEDRRLKRVRITIPVPDDHLITLPPIDNDQQRQIRCQPSFRLIDIALHNLGNLQLRNRGNRWNRQLRINPQFVQFQVHAGPRQPWVMPQPQLEVDIQIIFEKREDKSIKFISMFPVWHQGPDMGPNARLPWLDR